MGTGTSKMLELIERDGAQKPMLQYTLDMLVNLAEQIIVLVGFDGTTVCEMVGQRYGRSNVEIRCLRVSSDDGSDLEGNTAGTLKKFASQIAENIGDQDNLLFCVGDQPFMQLETVRDFVRRHLQQKADASILLSDVKNTPMECSTSTRVSLIDAGTMFFDTPPKEGPFDDYSTLVDVGLVLIKGAAFVAAAQAVDSGDVFSKLLCHLPRNADKIVTVRAVNPYQFVNVNEKDDRVLEVPEPLFPPQAEPTDERFVDRSEILLRWLEWNTRNRRPGEFSVFRFPDTYRPEFEVDTTLICHGTPACKADCTYRQKHMQILLDSNVGKYAVQSSSRIFRSSLFRRWREFGGQSIRELRDDFENSQECRASGESGDKWCKSKSTKNTGTHLSAGFYPVLNTAHNSHLLPFGRYSAIHKPGT